MDEHAERLRDHLLLEELASAWRNANWRWFREGLVPPVLRLADTTATLGTWRTSDRTLSMARTFVRTAPWARILEVLHHEMAHQYVAEVLKVTDETDHGPAFREVLGRMGHDLPEGELPPEDPALAKVRKLLALAGSPNPHEAQAAAKAAHRLMLTRNLDLARARAVSGYAVRRIGAARARHDAWEKLLLGILSSHFFVRVVWVPDVDTATVEKRRGRLGFRRTTVAECTGTPANLEIAAWVHDFLRSTAERSWTAHRRAHGLAGDRERRRYLAGLMVGFRQKLEEEAEVCRAEGLVWVGDPGVDDVVARRHPRLVRGGPIRVTGSSAYHQGKADGRRIVLHKPIRQSGPGGGQLTG
jgi:hypothetical protein